VNPGPEVWGENVNPLFEGPQHASSPIQPEPLSSIRIFHRQARSLGEELLLASPDFFQNSLRDAVYFFLEDNGDGRVLVRKASKGSSEASKSEYRRVAVLKTERHRE